MTFFFYAYVFFQSAGLEALWLRFHPTLREPHFWTKIFFVNALTHPLVVFYLLSDGRLNNLLAVVVAESFAIVSETFLLKWNFSKLGWSQAFTCSFTANLISWQLGPLLTWSMVKLFL